MRLHEIKNTHERPKSRRVGRGIGSGRGTFSGRGVKGQKARSGANSNIPRTFIGGSTALIQRLPKLKGFKSRAEKPTTVSLDRIAAVFKDGETVSIISLLEKGLISAREAEKGVRVVGAAKPLERSFVYDTESGRLTVTKKLLA
jgi:large subunit ribosomal protein L15